MAIDTLVHFNAMFINPVFILSVLVLVILGIKMHRRVCSRKEVVNRVARVSLTLQLPRYESGFLLRYHTFSTVTYYQNILLQIVFND